MFNHTLFLISYKTEFDSLLNEKRSPVERAILCDSRSSTRLEFYNYGQSDLRPEHIVAINSCEYNGEDDARLDDDETVYKITRVYRVDRDTTELTLSRRLK